MAFFLGALGVGAAVACSSVPDVDYVSGDAAPSATSATDAPSPVDTGVKDTGGGDTATDCGTPFCCGKTPCIGCTSQNDCASCGDGGACDVGDVCCRKGGSVTCRTTTQCK